MILLTLFIVFSVEAQVYDLEYTTYGVVKNKKYTESKTKASICFDQTHNHILVMKDGITILDVVALSSKTKDNGTDSWINCVDYKTKLVWDIYVAIVDNQRVFQAKSKKSEFWLKEPLK